MILFLGLPYVFRPSDILPSSLRLVEDVLLLHPRHRLEGLGPVTSTAEGHGTQARP